MNPIQKFWWWCKVILPGVAWSIMLDHYHVFIERLLGAEVINIYRLTAMVLYGAMCYLSSLLVLDLLLPDQYEGKVNRWLIRYQDSVGWVLLVLIVLNWLIVKVIA